MSVPLTYLAHENEYRSIVSRFVSGRMDPNSFVDQYFLLWKSDCDAQWDHLERQKHSGGAGGQDAIDPEEWSLGDLLSRIFTACDCFCDDPNDQDCVINISGIQLREEVAALAGQRWRLDPG